MPGTSTISGEQSVTFTDNMSFDGTERDGALGGDGQLWLGSANAPHVRKSVFTSSDSSLTFSYSDTSATEGQMDITISSGSVVGKFLRGNNAVLLSPNMGIWNIYGTTTLAGTSPVTTIGAGNTLNVTVQLSQAIAATDSTKVGLVAFNSADFTVDANGFVSLAGGGTSIDLTADSGGTASGAAFTLSGNGSTTTVRSGNTITTELTGLTNHAVLVGAGTSTITKVGPSATAGQVLQSAGAAADPAFSTATYPSTATGTGTILRADGTNWVATTATYPTTTTNSELLYSSSSNVIGGITTANNGVLITSNSGVPSWLANSGTPGYVLTANSGAPPSWQEIPGGSGVTVTEFTSSGTWTKSTSSTYVMMILWGGGGGGGSGRRGATTAAGGGGGGACGHVIYWYGLAEEWDTTETVTIGDGGTGGATQTSDATNGNPGANGGSTSVGNLNTTIGANGLGGTSTTATGGSVTTRVPLSVTLNYPVAITATGSAGGNGTNTIGANGAQNVILELFLKIPTGGGGGSGADTGTARQAGNGGNLVNYNSTVVLDGGAGGIRTGTINGANGNPGLTTNGFITGGTGGGGGGGGTTAQTGGAGGNGAVPGGGGGGGGGSITGSNSGTGGDGGKGKVIIYEY